MKFTKNTGLIFRLVYYIIKLVEMHGGVVLKKACTKYTNEEKLLAIKKVIQEGPSVHEVSVKYVLSDCSLLKRWVHNYKRNDYTIVTKKRERVIAGKTTEQLEQQVREFKKENQAL